MGFFDFLFGKKNTQEEKSVPVPEKKVVNSAKPSTISESKSQTQKIKSLPSVKSISEGAPFDFDFTSMSVVKQYYSNHSEEIKLSSPVKIRLGRSSFNGEVRVTFSNLSELRSKGIIQHNLSLNPHFAYQADGEDNEFASAEINNSFSAVASGKEYISMFQISKQKGKFISFLINNLPGDQNFYYLLIMRDDISESSEVSTKPVTDTTLSKIDQLAVEANRVASTGNKYAAQKTALDIFTSISNNPNELANVTKLEDVALALGRLMEGDFFTENEEIIRAVGLTYYFLSKAIKEGYRNPYLFVYRFSTVWEYNKAFYRLFAHSEGEELSMSPFDIMGQSALMAYDHHIQGMQMADALVEPRVSSIDPALGNIFREVYGRYRATPKQQIIDLGNKYHRQLFDYLESKVKSSDLVF